MKKLRRKNGFTLIEMLIVVAIVAILIAVSIPLVGNSLERAREATDAANERAFKAALLTAYLEATTDTGGNKLEINKVYCYDAAAGTFTLEKATGNPYGQGTANAGAHQGNGGNHQGCYLWGHLNEAHEVHMAWMKDTVLNDPLKIDGIATITGPWLLLNS